MVVVLAVLIVNKPIDGYAVVNRMVYGETGIPTSMDPVTSNEMITVRLMELIYNGLVKQNDRGDIVPDLAQSWEFLPNNMGIIFQLRKDVFWHNNQFAQEIIQDSTKRMMFTAEDVVFTINVLKNSKSQVPNRIRFEFIQQAQALGTHRLKITFKRPVANSMGKLAFKIIPKFALGGKEFLTREDKFVHNPIGTGPFFVEKKNQDGEVVLERNKDYHGNKVKLPRILMKPYADRNIMAQALLFEAIDLITFVNPRNIQEIDGDKRFRLIPYNGLSYSFFAFNFNNPILAKLNIRKAISYAINRKEMLDSFFHGKGKLISGPFAPGSWGYNLAVKDYDYDPKETRRLLRDEGFYKINEEGILIKDGKPLQFTLKVPIYSEGESVKRVILAFQNYLQKVGIRINIAFEEWYVWKADVFNKHDFDIIYASWAFDDSNDISSLFHSGEIGSGKNNFIGYRNKLVDALIVEAKTTIDFEKKRTINRKLHEILAAEFPYTFLWTLTNYAAVTNKLRNVSIHPYRFFSFIDQWYFEN